MEIDRAGQLLEDNTGRPVRYFAFPFDACGTEALAHLRQRDYLGARCGGRGVSDPRLPDGFLSKSDAWGPTFSIDGNRGPCMGLAPPGANVAPEALPFECRRFVLNQYVDDAIAGKGWAIRTFTGFSDDPGAFQPIALGDYNVHLDYIKQRSDAGQLWVAGPHERAALPLRPREVPAAHGRGQPPALPRRPRARMPARDHHPQLRRHRPHPRASRGPQRHAVPHHRGRQDPRPRPLPD